MINDFGFTEQHFAELMGVLQTEIDAFVQQHGLTDYINAVLANRAAKHASTGLYTLLHRDMRIPFRLIDVRGDNTLCVYLDSPVHAEHVPEEYEGVKVITIWRY